MSSTVNDSTEPSKSSLERGADADRLEKLIGRVASGSQPALTELYELTVGRVFAIARFILRSKEDAEEIVCDVYHYVWKHAGVYSIERGSVMAWLAIVTRNRSITQLRTRHRWISFDDDRYAGEVLTGATQRPEELLMLVESGTELHRLLQTLPIERQQILHLNFFQGLSHEQISKKLNIPLGTVKSNLRRTLLSLRDRLRKRITWQRV